MSENVDRAPPAAAPPPYPSPLVGKGKEGAGRRRLTPEEEHLWSMVSRGVRPLRSAKKALSAARHKPAKAGFKPALAAAKNPAKPAVKPPVGAGFKSAAVAAAVPRPAGRPGQPPVAIARRDMQQLYRGRAAIDARIDLHGMTQVEAHDALLRFLERCQAAGAKFALVITGKGAPDSPGSGRGVLRRQVPLWLALAEFHAYVLGFDIAKAGHGGDGALYVRLRKPRRHP
jgi:DNA-nicking Smr family endonuclease